jgi:predicted nucleic acid-binding protein
VLQRVEPEVSDAAIEAYRWVEYHQRRFPVVAGDETDLAGAVSAVQHHGLSFWNAMLWATASRAGCRMLFSEDLQDGRRLDGVLFVNPFASGNRKLVDLALPELPRR